MSLDFKRKQNYWGRNNVVLGAVGTFIAVACTSWLWKHRGHE